MLIRKYIVAIVIILIILVLGIVRSLSANHFKNDARRWAEPSVTQSNTITMRQFAALTGQNLLINLDKDTVGIREIMRKALTITPDSILNKNNINRIMKHEGPVFLFSSEPGMSARMWMILSQMGRINIYILTNNPDNEILKYKFRPDSSTATSIRK